MATDYDAPRKNEEDSSEESIEELKARRHDKSSGKVDEDEFEERWLKFVEDEVGSKRDPRDAEQAVRSKVRQLQWWNVLVPVALLGVFGLVLWMVRRNQKRAFLAQLN